MLITQSRVLRVLMAILFAVLSFNGLRAGPSQTGQWGPVLQGATWPAIRAVHMVLLHNGKVLIIDERREPQGETTVIIGQYAVYDPSEGSFTPVIDMPVDITDPLGLRRLDLECAGHCQLADGKVIFYGGRTWMRQTTIIYDPLLEGTPEGPWMQLDLEPGNRHRFYPTLTLLADGRVLSVAGRTGPATDNVPEIFDPNAPLGQQWSELFGGAYCRLYGDPDCAQDPNCDQNDPNNPFRLRLEEGCEQLPNPFHV